MANTVYTNNAGFSFELPEDWQRNPSISPITFFGPQGEIGKTREVIQLMIGPVLPSYITPEAREEFLSEPGAEVIRGNLGVEQNVVILKKKDDSEISAVRDGVHYTISHSHDPATQRAIEMLCKTATFASNSPPPPDADANSSINRLLKDLYSGGARAQEAEEVLVKNGEDSVDDILESIAHINGLLNGSIRDRALDPVVQMDRLKDLVQVMGRIQHPATIKALFDALADSATAISSYRRQRDEASYRGEPMTEMSAEMHAQTARSLNQATLRALAAFGEQIVPHAKRYLQSTPPAVQPSLRKLLRIVRRRWWQFWKQ